MAQMKRKTISANTQNDAKKEKVGAPPVNAVRLGPPKSLDTTQPFAHSYGVARVPPNLGCSVCFVGSNPLLLEPAAICVIRGQNTRLRRSRAV
jgi:hypothetical protein